MKFLKNYTLTRLLGVVLLCYATSTPKWDWKAFCLYMGIIIYVNAVVESSKK